MENNEFVAGALYDAALIDFAEWRNDPDNLHDVALFDEMLKKINAMGYGSYSSYPDITMRRHDDPNVIDIIADYLGKFDDEGITGELVRSIGTKNGKIATERIIDSFFGLSETSKCNHATFYDTALTNICDKRFADKYVEMISNPKYARWLLGLMKLLGRWKNEKAKRVMLGYLGSDNEDMVNMTVRKIPVRKRRERSGTISCAKGSSEKEDVVCRLRLNEVSWSLQTFLCINLDGICYSQPPFARCLKLKRFAGYLYRHNG